MPLFDFVCLHEVAFVLHVNEVLSGFTGEPEPDKPETPKGLSNSCRHKSMFWPPLHLTVSIDPLEWVN